MIAQPRATIADLEREPGKAELVNGEMVRFVPTGFKPGRASAEIFVSLRMHERTMGDGYAVPDNIGFLVRLPHRESFSPDAAWYVGPPSGMKFLPMAPLFAAEVRSENDHGAAAELALRQKRLDYFAAGTAVVWDVDLDSEEVVRKYTTADPERAIVFRRGEQADAEPAVPGWTLPVDDLFA